MDSEKRSSVSQYLHTLLSSRSRLFLAACIVLFFGALFLLLVGMVWPDGGRSLFDKSGEGEQIQELSGTVLLLGEGGSFIRLSVVGKGVYSIGLNGDTRISENGAALDVMMLKPFSRVFVTALKLPDTEKFDFLARSITLPRIAQQTPEERAAGLSDTVPTMIAN